MTHNQKSNGISLEVTFFMPSIILQSVYSIFTGLFVTSSCLRLAQTHTHIPDLSLHAAH